MKTISLLFVSVFLVFSSCQKSETDKRDVYLGTYTGTVNGKIEYSKFNSSLRDSIISTTAIIKVSAGTNSDELSLVDYDASESATFKGSGFVALKNGMAFNILEQTVVMSQFKIEVSGYSGFVTSDNMKYDGGYLNDSKALIFGITGNLLVTVQNVIYKIPYQVTYNVKK